MSRATTLLYSKGNSQYYKEENLRKEEEVYLQGHGVYIYRYTARPPLTSYLNVTRITSVAYSDIAYDVLLIVYTSSPILLYLFLLPNQYMIYYSIIQLVYYGSIASSYRLCDQLGQVLQVRRCYSTKPLYSRVLTRDNRPL